MIKHWKTAMVAFLSVLGIAITPTKANAYFHVDAAFQACIDYDTNYQSADATFRLYGKRASHTQWNAISYNRVSSSRVQVRFWWLTSDLYMRMETYCDASGVSYLDNPPSGHYVISSIFVHTLGFGYPQLL